MSRSPARAPRAAPSADRVSAPPFPWLPGEHVTVVGDTGTGKTYMMVNALLPMRRYVVVLKTKADDDDERKWRGYYRTETHKALDNPRHERILLYPRYEHRAVEGWHMLNKAMRQGEWTVVIDELWACERLGLGEPIEYLLTQGRSQGITMVLGQQRPVTTSRFAISQTKHFFSFRVEGRDAKTIAEATTPRVLPYISEEYAARTRDDTHLLRKYQFVYYNREQRYVTAGTSARLGAILRLPGRTTPEAIQGRASA
jgi:hypothetical protein